MKFCPISCVLKLVDHWVCLFLIIYMISDTVGRDFLPDRNLNIQKCGLYSKLHKLITILKMAVGAGRCLHD